MHIVAGRANAVWKRRWIASLATIVVAVAALASPVVSPVEVGAASAVAPVVWQSAVAASAPRASLSTSGQVRLIPFGFCPGGVGPCP